MLSYQPKTEMYTDRTLCLLLWVTKEGNICVCMLRNQRREICGSNAWIEEGWRNGSTIGSKRQEYGDARHMQGNTRYTSGVSLHPSPRQDTAAFGENRAEGKTD